MLVTRGGAGIEFATLDLPASAACSAKGAPDGTCLSVRGTSLSVDTQIPSDVRMRIAVTSEGVNVAAFCREHGISRETFYVWRRRCRTGGLDELEARSRAPRSSPHRIAKGFADSL